MKPIALLFLLVPTLCLSQSISNDAFSQLQTLYSKSTLLPDTSVSYDPSLKLLTLSGYRINVTADTHVKAEIDRTDNSQRNRIVFYCQNKTYITHKDRPGERHAQLSVPMKKKKASRYFCKLFEKLKKG